MFWADDGLDTGPILLQRQCAVEPNDTVDTLYNRFLFPEGIKAMVTASHSPWWVTRSHYCAVEEYYYSLLFSQDQQRLKCDFASMITSWKSPTKLTMKVLHIFHKFQFVFQNIKILPCFRRLKQTSKWHRTERVWAGMCVCCLTASPRCRWRPCSSSPMERLLGSHSRKRERATRASRGSPTPRWEDVTSRSVGSSGWGWNWRLLFACRCEFECDCSSQWGAVELITCPGCHPGLYDSW